MMSTNFNLEKTGHENVDHVDKGDTEEAMANDARIKKFTTEQQRKIIRHIDLRLVIPLGVLYCACLMDRTNLSSAAIAGMLEDLKLTVHDRYSLISWIFFIPYVLFQPPATVVIRKIGPRTFLSVIVVCWGATMIGFGFCHNWETMMGLRVILGVLEAGFFPGCAYLLSTWYPRYDLQKRNAGFFIIGGTASAFSGILAYGLEQMAGQAGLAGWRWIFIMEGIITCIAGMGGYFLIVDFPELAAKSWRFLTPAESEFVVARIEIDRRDAIPQPFTIAAYLQNAFDAKIWGFASLYMLATTNTYAIAYFLPIILRYGMGFSIAAALCLTAPPYVAAGIVMYYQAVIGDKFHIRGPLVIFNSVLGLIGLPLLGFATNNGVRYFGAFLATICGNANVPALLTYQANNVRGQWKRAFCSATLVGFGGIGGIIGTTIFREQDAPTYRPGIEGILAANGLSIVIVLAMSLAFYRANKRADAGDVVIEHQKGFRYTL
ncbi:unnamed protein product [Calypogeia fissa]